MTNSPTSPQPQQPGFALAWMLSLGLIGSCAAAYLYAGGSIEVVRLIGRWTIRAAVLLFSLAFSAEALASLFPGRTTALLFGARRSVLLAFAIAFALHLAAIARFYVLDASLFWSVSPVVLIILRSVGVGFIVLMLLASLSRPWRGLLKGLSALGAYYVWGAFLAGFAKRIPQDDFYIAPVALLVLALLINLAAWCVRRTRRPAER